MKSWRIAWRIKRPALRAAVVPFWLIFVLVIVEGLWTNYDYGPAIIRMALRWSVEPGVLYSAVVVGSRALIDALHMATDGLLIAALLEMLLSGRKLDDSLPPFLPTKRAVYFALALFPIGIVTSLLQQYGNRATMVWLFDEFEAERLLGLRGVIEPVKLFLEAPTMQWVLAGLVAPLLALRLLRLPALTADGQAISSARPTISLAGLLLAAALLGVFLGVVSGALVYRGVEAGLRTLWGSNTTDVPHVVGVYAETLVGSYVLTFVLTLLIAAGVSLLLWRRRGSSAASADRLAPANGG